MESELRRRDDVMCQACGGVATHRLYALDGRSLGVFCRTDGTAEQARLAALPTSALPTSSAPRERVGHFGI